MMTISKKGREMPEAQACRATKLVTICGQPIDEKHKIIGISIEGKDIINR